MGAGPQMMSFGWTFHPYLPKVSGTMRASSMKWTVPFGMPVVPDV